MHVHTYRALFYLNCIKFLVLIKTIILKVRPITIFQVCTESFQACTSVLLVLRRLRCCLISHILFSNPPINSVVYGQAHLLAISVTLATDL